MESRWSEAEAAALLEESRERWGADLALRTYGSRLLGADPALVLHGGGNTSVKTTRVDRLGDERAVIHVKASGHDLATIGHGLRLRHSQHAKCEGVFDSPDARTRAVVQVVPESPALRTVQNHVLAAVGMDGV